MWREGKTLLNEHLDVVELEVVVVEADLVEVLNLCVAVADSPHVDARSDDVVLCNHNRLGVPGVVRNVQSVTA